MPAASALRAATRKRALTDRLSSATGCAMALQARKVVSSRKTMVRNGTGILFRPENDAPHNDRFIAATVEKYYKRDPDEAVAIYWPNRCSTAPETRIEKNPGRERMRNPLRIAGLGIATVFAMACGLPANAQEVSGGATTTARPMTKSPNVSQAALDNAAKERKQLAAFERQLRTDALLRRAATRSTSTASPRSRLRSSSRPRCSSRWRPRRSSSTASCS